MMSTERERLRFAGRGRVTGKPASFPCLIHFRKREAEARKKMFDPLVNFIIVGRTRQIPYRWATRQRSYHG